MFSTKSRSRSARHLLTPVSVAVCAGSSVPSKVAAALALGVIGLAATTTRAQLVSPYTGQTAPVTVCFDEGTDPNYVTRMSLFVNAENQWFAGSTDYYTGSRWSGAQGTPRSLTWSFVPDGLSISSGAGEPVAPSTLFASMDNAFGAQGGRTTWVNRFQQMFDRWHQLSGVTFTRVTTGGHDWDDGAAWGTGSAAGLRGDIRISMHPIDGPSNVLAYTFFPSSGDMVIDASDINLFGGAANQNRFLRDCCTHELGHALGLEHVCSANSNQLMEPFINTAFDGPQQDDIRGVQRLYGDPMESNDSPAAATALGTLTVGSTLSVGTIPAPPTGANDVNAALCSIDAAGKTDWYSVNAAVGMVATITATPVGSTYDNTAQASDGSCPSTTSVNALAQADLVVDVFASDGQTSLAHSNSSGVGVAEVASGVGLNPGINYIRVTAGNSPSQSQLYRLSVTGNAPPVCPSFTLQPQGQTLCPGDTLTLTVAADGNPAPTYQWQRNNVDIVGEVNPTFTVFSVTPFNNATYHCVATNPCGSLPSDDAVVTVLNTAITQQPQSISVPAGSPASFTVVSTDTTSYQWFKDNNPLPNSNAATYTINSVTPGDDGVYTVQVSGTCGGETSDGATLTVTGGSSCYANCDQSTVNPFLNVADFTCFLQKYAAGDPYANCDNSSQPPTLNVADFTCFLQKFAAGCSAP